MISKFEKFIKNSSFEVTWIVYYVIFQISVGILNFLIFGIDKINGSIDFPEIYDNIWKYSIIVFIIVFIFAILSKKGFSKLISSFITFCFFYILSSMFVSQSPELIIPRKYEDLDAFIIEENELDKKQYKETLIEILFKKIFNKNS